LKFLANENVPISSVKALKIRGFDITAIGMDNPSISDEQVMNIAIEEMRTIITYDSDYGELIFKHGYKPKAGVIFIRNQPSDPLETAKIIEKLISYENVTFEGALTVVDSNSIRQKKF
jgi:predicted nuclease of predicted toxin-antitoxin system